MPVIIALTVIIQAFFIFHVFRSGRPYWWAFIILSFPIAGCLAYYFVEIFPSSREHTSARKAARQFVKTLQPNADLERRAEELAVCGSIDNKLGMALECEQCGMYVQAVKLYESCLTGVHAQDPKILFALAQALLLNQRYEDARERLKQLVQAHPAYKPNDAKLLLARILEAQGDRAGAILLYEELVPVYAGLEAKCRYGLHLKSIGHAKQADGVFQELIEHARRFKIKHEEELQWVRLAQRNLSA